MYPSSFGERIAYYRKKAGFSQKDLAATVGMSPNAISLYEKNKREPNLLMLICLAKALHISGDTLLGLEPCPDSVTQNRDEYRWLQIFRKLNGMGQKRALEHLLCFAEIPQYSK